MLVPHAEANILAFHLKSCFVKCTVPNFKVITNFLFYDPIHILRLRAEGEDSLESFSFYYIFCVYFPCGSFRGFGLVLTLNKLDEFEQQPQQHVTYSF